MSEDFNQRSRYVAHRRSNGMIDPRAMEAANDDADDWRGKCHYCHEELSGSRAELTAHTCREWEAVRND